VTTGFTFKGKTAAPSDVDEYEEYDPACKSSSATGQPGLVEECTKHERTEDLREPLCQSQFRGMIPVEEVVECTCTDVEVVCIHVIELVCIRPVGCPEQREKKDNIMICFKSFKQTFKLGPEQN
jgi:hypothetical protein